MATTFDISFASGSTVLTSRLRAVKVLTDLSKLAVSIVRDPDDAADTIFSTTLYAYGGIVEIADVGSLIEESFRRNSRIADKITITAGTTSFSFKALYCEFDFDAGFDMTKRFLTPSKSAVVHPDSFIALSDLDTSSSDYTVNVVGNDEDGNPKLVSMEFPRMAGEITSEFSVDEIVRTALAYTEIGQADMVHVSYFTVSHAGRTKLFFVADSPQYLLFYFRNAFNAPEFIDVEGLISHKLKVDRDSVSSGGRMLQYNQTSEQTFEVSTGPLSNDAVRDIMQLINSRHVSLMATSRDFEIIITDHSLEYDNGDEELSSLKFTFRFRDDCPVFLSDDLSSLYAPRGSIFTAQFTPQYV